MSTRNDDYNEHQNKNLVEMLDEQQEKEQILHENESQFEDVRTFFFLFFKFEKVFINRFKNFNNYLITRH